MWQHIETAPKDKRIMLFIPSKGATFGRWEIEKHHRKPNPYWTTERAQMGVFWHRENQPTHWQPEPEAP